MTTPFNVLSRERRPGLPHSGIRASRLLGLRHGHAVATWSYRLPVPSMDGVGSPVLDGHRPGGAASRRSGPGNRYSPVPMPDYDAIVVGAGHNGLTAAAVMARGGMRVLCLEKNHFIGGMASTTELIRGYRFELAGSIQFPIPAEIYDDLGFVSSPIYKPEGQSASIGDAGQPPIFLYSDPDRLLAHLSDTLGL